MSSKQVSSVWAASIPHVVFGREQGSKVCDSRGGGVLAIYWPGLCELAFLLGRLAF